MSNHLRGRTAMRPTGVGRFSVVSFSELFIETICHRRILTVHGQLHHSCSQPRFSRTTLYWLDDVWL